MLLFFINALHKKTCIIVLCVCWFFFFGFFLVTGFLKNSETSHKKTGPLSFLTGQAQTSLSSEQSQTEIRIEGTEIVQLNFKSQPTVTRWEQKNTAQMIIVHLSLMRKTIFI